MKYCGVILVVLAVFVCQNEASVSTVMSQLNETVQKMQDSLQAHKLHLVDEQNKRLYAFMGTFQGVVAHFVETATKELDGKNQECQTSLQVELKTAQDKVSAALVRCREDNTPDIKPAQDATDAVIAKGVELIAAMNKIEADCESEKERSARVCVVKRVPRMSLAVGVYLASVGKLRLADGVAVGLAYGKISKCVISPMRVFTVEVANARRNAHTCVKATQ